MELSLSLKIIASRLKSGTGIELRGLGAAPRPNSELI